jgi:hypothetical protein
VHHLRKLAETADPHLQDCPADLADLLGEIHLAVELARGLAVELARGNVQAAHPVGQLDGYHLR